MDDSVDENNSNSTERCLSASDDFLCGCCFDLMIKPTTLTCGHSFCRLCVANWYFKSKKRECPQCRSPWSGNLQTNITLRNLLGKMHSDSVAEREAEIMTDEAKATLVRFDAELSSQKQSESDATGNIGFFRGIFFATGIVVVSYLTYYWSNTDQDLLIHKPLVRWSVDDVESWFTDMGLWTEDYVKIVREKNIGGNLMYELDETNIVNIFNITDSLHKRALINAINVVKERGIKPPSNLWEFKAVNPGWALFLVYGMKDFPRSTLLYLYWFEYDTMFLPFAHVVCPLSENSPKYDFTSSLPPLTSVQWAEFIPKYLFLPYLLIGEYTWDWLDIHYWTSRFILVNCVIMSLLEVNSVTTALRGEHISQLKEFIKKTFKGYLSILMFVCIWPVIPSLICDCVFYVALYFSPYQAGEQLYNEWSR